MTDTVAQELIERGACGWERGGTMLRVARCEQPIDRTVVLGCVHEHLTPPLATCKSCAADLDRELAAGTMLCARCVEHDDETPLVLVETVLL